MRRFWLIFVLALAAVVPTTRHRNIGDCGGSSRLGTAESLVERGTFALDQSSLAYTCDVMEIDGRRYSDKPPLLSVAAAGVYLVLHRGLGLDFDHRSVPVGARPPHDHVYLAMTVLVVGLAHALLLAVFDQAAGAAGVADPARALATLSLGFATLLWPLSGIFNSHTVAALLLFAGLWLALRERGPRPGLAGFWLGLAVAVDIPAGGLGLGLALVASPARVRLLLGALGPLLAHGALNVWIVGDLKPFQMHRELYSEATGHAGPTTSGFAEDAGLGFYAWRNLFGSLGAFSLTPLLLVALPLAIAAAGAGERERRFARASVALFLALAALYVVAWPEAVGCSYGMRHLVPGVAPLLLAAATRIGPSRARLRLWAASAALSAVLAGGGLPNAATCAGFVSDARGREPARVFFENLRVEVWPRIRPRAAPGQTP